MSAAQDDVQEFAALLSRLKDRTDRSYGQLARRLNMNTSTLHRYCAGDAVPLDFAPVERFAALCEATPQERLELHRLWILAVAARQRSRAAASAAAGSTPSTGDGSPADTAEETTGLRGGGPASTDAPPRHPWYRRRRLLVAAAVATALLATLGSLSALPDDGPRASDSVQGSDPSRTTPTGAPRPKSTASPNPSPTTPSPSAGASEKSSPKSAPSEDGPSKEAGRQQPPAGVPLTWSANSHVWQAGCGHDYVVDRPPSQVAPPPAPQDAEAWAGSQNAVHGEQTMIEISVQGKTSTAVVLKALRVRVVGRSAPAGGPSTPWTRAAAER